mgnify:CR=1 FL=1
MRRSIALPATRRAPTSGGAHLVCHTPVWPSAVRELRNRESSAYACNACMRDLWACVWSDSERAACTCVPCGRAVRAGSAGVSQSVSQFRRGPPALTTARVARVRPVTCRVRHTHPICVGCPPRLCVSERVASYGASTIRSRTRSYPPAPPCRTSTGPRRRGARETRDRSSYGRDYRLLRPGRAPPGPGLLPPPADARRLTWVQDGQVSG